ncbi:MAG TPA: hypothetical protein VF401_04395 [Candidatus Saccharimonadales bacterium]
MKKLLTFIISLLVDLIRYSCLLGGLIGIVYGVVLVRNHDSRDTNPLVVFAVAFGFILVGVLITYLLVGKNKRKTRSALLGDLFISLLPPW